ncbi:SDR family oxidoreductase [Halopelagius fulvigenes]|uniref:SDR family oxidoreductase n=1 Tax=Halopelagius fulvigenes TaxID=1198324 RepID=A0ABD5U1P9_9EURY
MSAGPNLKSVEDQVIVITGASSGIGLTTARTAAERGAKVVVAARSEDALRELTEEIRADGGEAEYVVADVRNRDDVREIAETARESFGGFDTWVNNAGTFIYGKLQEVPVEDMRDLFETNYWGVVYGSLEAAEHLKQKEGGGTIINVGSVVSDQAVLLQGTYSASKHAVKGFTDALRMELEEEGAPVSVTLVKPSAIDTPYPSHAKNHMDVETDIPKPVYAPETVARTILFCAERPRREVYVGSGGKSIQLLGRYAPELTDRIIETVFYRFQRKETPRRPKQWNSLGDASENLEERGKYDGPVMERSLYTKASLRSALSGAALVGVGLTAAALYLRNKLGRSDGGAGRVREEIRESGDSEDSRSLFPRL